MPVTLKLTPGQHDKLRADSFHYEVGPGRYDAKSSTYEIECSPAHAKQIKKIVED